MWGCHRNVLQMPNCLPYAYRLVNETGLRLSYWVEQGGIKGRPFPVEARAESAVMVSPIEKTVILSDSQQQVRLLNAAEFSTWQQHALL